MTGFQTSFISFRSSFCSNTAFLGHPKRNKCPLHFSLYTHPFFPTVQSPSDVPHICIYLTFPLSCKLESRGVFYSLLCLQCLTEESLKYSSSYTYLWDSFFSEFKDSWRLKTKRCQIFELFLTFSDPPETYLIFLHRFAYIFSVSIHVHSIKFMVLQGLQWKILCSSCPTNFYSSKIIPVCFHASK